MTLLGRQFSGGNSGRAACEVAGRARPEVAGPAETFFRQVQNAQVGLIWKRWGPTSFFVKLQRLGVRHPKRFRLYLDLIRFN